MKSFVEENKQQQDVQQLQESTPVTTSQALLDNRPSAIFQRKLQEHIGSETTNPKSNFTIQKKKKKTGLPDQLKNGVEQLSGYSMDDVNVHYNSPEPAQLQAHAFAQGTDIHIAAGQEKHLPHEAWHVVQQKQGRVKATKQLKGRFKINDEQQLEREADVMGSKAKSTKKHQNYQRFQLKNVPKEKSPLSLNMLVERQSVIQKVSKEKFIEYVERVKYESKKPNKESIENFWNENIGKNNIPEEWITESLLGYVFDEDSWENHKQYFQDTIVNLLMALSKFLENIEEGEKKEFFKQMIQEQLDDFDDSKISKISQIETVESFVGGEITIDNKLKIKLSNPIISIKNPELQTVNAFIQLKDERYEGEVREVNREGFFEISCSAITSECENTNLDDYKIGIIQNVSSSRIATYDNGTTVKIEFENLLDKLKEREEPWFKSGAEQLSKEKSTSVTLSDSPSHAVPAVDGESPLSSFVIKDEFKAYITLQIPDGTYRVLGIQEWSFTCDNESAKYVSGKFTMLDDESQSGLITSGDTPQDRFPIKQKK